VRTRRPLAAVLALLLAGPAAAQPDGHAATSRPRHGDAARGPRAPGGSPPHLEGLRARAERESLRAETELRRANRYATRRAEAALAPAPETRADVAALRDRALREEDLDALRARVDLASLELRAGRPLGPVTRRVLERSALAVEQTQRAADVAGEARARDAELRRRETREPAF